MISRFSDSPSGENFLFNNISELVDFINFLGFSNPLELESFGIYIKKRQMNELELVKYGLKYDPDFQESTLIYDCENFKCNPLILPIFNKNKYLSIEEQICTSTKSELSILKIKESDIEKLSESYQFPCVIYINLSIFNGRSGKNQFKIWQVSSIKNIKTIHTLKQIDETYSEKWISNYNNSVLMQKNTKFQ